MLSWDSDENPYTERTIAQEACEVSVATGWEAMMTVVRGGELKL
jgi:hypothetical protein